MNEAWVPVLEVRRDMFALLAADIAGAGAAEGLWKRGMYTVSVLACPSNDNFTSSSSMSCSQAGRGQDQVRGTA